VVLAIHPINPDELWLAFATALNFRYIPIQVAGDKIMDPMTCAALPVSHAFRGCDTISAFGGREPGVRTWQVFPEVTEAFESLLLRKRRLVKQ
jgi:hypothetical protein